MQLASNLSGRFGSVVKIKFVFLQWLRCPRQKWHCFVKHPWKNCSNPNCKMKDIGLLLWFALPRTQSRLSCVKDVETFDSQRLGCIEIYVKSIKLHGTKNNQKFIIVMENDLNVRGSRINVKNNWIPSKYKYWAKQLLSFNNARRQVFLNSKTSETVLSHLLFL